MNTTVNERITALRKVMTESNISAIIIPTSDPHMSEYIPAHWKIREWLSGFTGSAGTVVITLKEAGLWTDSRYFLQAARQLANSDIKLFKDGLKETPSISSFLTNTLPPHSVVAFDGEMISESNLIRWKEEMSQFTINTNFRFTDSIWPNRPTLPQTPFFIYEKKYSGQDTISKIKQLRTQHLDKKNCGILSTALDEIAWILNIRGNEIQNNPVVISFLLITDTYTLLFIDKQKINAQTKEYLNNQEIQIKSYSEIYSVISNIELSEIRYDPNTTNVRLAQAIPTNIIRKTSASPIALMKAIRNSTEIKNIRKAMIKDGIALTKFLIWLEQSVETSQITEIDISNKLYELRSQQALFKGESFDTIAGYKEHGAIVHYTATPETNTTLKREGYLLVDSGAQYLDGTTDITRTIALGKLSNEEKKDYTLVLKGHIALANAKFPEGTRGSQLDILARLPLWENKKNFLHGTGHGVGHFLCVHEGPQSIRMNENPITLQLGMLTSNEPGIYIDNSHGIRIENLVLVVPFGAGLFSNYYQFETLTLCPICTKGVIKEMLSSDEVSWLNDYHQKVYDTLVEYLDKEEQKWLQKATAKI